MKINLVRYDREADGQLINPKKVSWDTREPLPCSSASRYGSVYLAEQASLCECPECRAGRTMLCGRCNKDTYNNTQGHYWSFCNVTQTVREFHFCCPGDCELEAKR
jgi:hypothetical protein